MRSTFMGLETSLRALHTQQAALHTTGHNIANANTPGYTRQRVNFEQTEPYPAPAMNRPAIPGQMGTGVKAGDIQRVRDEFIDMQFRGENSKFSYWEGRSEVLSQMENIMNEPTDEGLANTMDQFWNALQDLAVEPQNSGARRVVRQRGIALAETFNYTYDSLKAIQTDYRKEIDVTQTEANSIIRQINQVNKQIGDIEPHGYLPNDLYDERDRLVDQLSSIMNVKVKRVDSGGNPSKAAEGLYDIYVADPEGNILTDKNGRQIKLVDANSQTATGIHIQYVNRAESDSPVQEIKFFELNENKEGFKGITDPDTATANYHLESFNDLKSNGKLKAYIEGYGYLKDPSPSTSVEGIFTEMMSDLDEMAFTFADHFNLVHQSGWSINDIENGTQSGTDFFSYSGTISPTEDDPSGAASRIQVSQDIIDDIDNIAAAAEGNVIAGAMERESVDPNTVGNPGITGIFDTSVLTTNPKQVRIDLTHTQGNTPPWTYTLSEIDESGNISATSSPVDITAADEKVTINGVKVDFSNVEIDTGGNSVETWTFTFPAEGVKPSDEAFVGNGSNALALANVKDAKLDYDGSLTSVQSFYQGMIGDMGVNAAESNRLADNALTLKDSVDKRRMSTSSVSLDEEMTNMIKFQHAYNAAARNMTAVDEMLDKIINGMGLVGR
ncbi:flagellar hook-associated protein FlgK [Bacillus tianshenii]|nr:flagellar hook-associated protein FlgK [Bacillus tianshenii]